MDFKLPERKKISNKATYGRVLNIAGSDYMTGAAYLSSVSALKIGCGYCFLCSGETVIRSVAAKTSNVVFVPLKKLEENIQNTDVTEIGCGLSTTKTAKSIFERVLKTAAQNKPLVIDADGLNILSEEKYKKIFLKRNFKKVVLTPHPKEASRLLKVPLEDILNDINENTRQLSEMFGSTIVLKTHQTCVASPDGKIYTNTTGNSALAKAGSGDVLTGIISGIIAQGEDIFDAACLGVYLHGLCGELAGKDLTPYCVMADDLIEYIPKVINSL